MGIEHSTLVKCLHFTDEITEAQSHTVVVYQRERPTASVLLLAPADSFTSLGLTHGKANFI